MNDTTAAAEKARLSALRAMTPERRFSMALGWSQSIRDMSRAGLRERFPDHSEEQLNRLMAERLLGPELAAKVYGPPTAHG